MDYLKQIRQKQLIKKNFVFDDLIFSYANYLNLARPKQWIKNFFVFGALIFSCEFLIFENLIRSILAFIAFCLVSSSVYIMNDIVDAEQDRNHPKKKNRPIASGVVSVKSAILLMIILLSISFGIMFYLDYIGLILTIIYFVNNIIYSFKVKNIVLLDVISIAFGFLLRVFVGGVIINVKLSIWILLCTLFISLFLGFEKRKGELVSLENDASRHRKILEEYSIELTSELSNIVCTCTVVFYAVYTVLVPTSRYMVITNIFVIYGLFRYRYLSKDKSLGGNPTDVILTDKSLIINILLYAITSVCIIALF